MWEDDDTSTTCGDGEETIIERYFEYTPTNTDGSWELRQNIIKKDFDILTKQEEHQFAEMVKEASLAELKSWVDLDTMQTIPLHQAKNIIDSRWVLKWKNKDGKRIIKARLVIRGFKDNQFNMETSSGTASRWSQRLICSTASTHKWDMMSADVGTAFLQGLTFEKMAKLTGEPLREVCIKMPLATCNLLKQFPQFKHFNPLTMALKLIKPVYGLKGAPRAWRLMLDKILAELGGSKMVVDRQIYMWFHNDKLVMLASTHVDDLKVTGEASWMSWLLLKIEEYVGKLTVKYAQEGFDHCGIHHKQLADKTITMDQNAYVAALKPIPLPKTHDPEADASETLHGAYMTLLGGLGWVTLTRYDVSIFICCLQRFNKKPKMRHLQNANKLLAWMQRNTFTCHYHPFPNGTKRRVICISDSAFKKEDHEGLAMRGALIAIGECKDGNPGGNLHIIEHYSRKQKRVVRSTFAAEIHALVDSIEHGKLLMYALCELEYGPQKAIDLLKIEELGRWPLPLEAVVDAYSVFSTSKKQESKNPSEETLITLVAILREALITNRMSKLWWVDTRDMLADGLNKGAVPRWAIQQLALTGQWKLEHKSESHSHHQSIIEANRIS